MGPDRSGGTGWRPRLKVKSPQQPTFVEDGQEDPIRLRCPKSSGQSRYILLGQRSLLSGGLTGSQRDQARGTQPIETGRPRLKEVGNLGKKRQRSLLEARGSEEVLDVEGSLLNLQFREGLFFSSRYSWAALRRLMTPSTPVLQKAACTPRNARTRRIPGSCHQGGWQGACPCRPAPI